MKESELSFGVDRFDVLCSFASFVAAVLFIDTHI
jgi:hypothetical protein